MAADPSGPVVLYTLLHKAGARAYLLAAKSFLRFCPGLEVVVQSDGTLDEEARDELQRHIENVRILDRGVTDDFLRGWLAGFSLGVDLSACRLFIPLKLVNVVARFPGRRVILFELGPAVSAAAGCRAAVDRRGERIAVRLLRLWRIGPGPNRPRDGL